MAVIFLAFMVAMAYLQVNALYRRQQYRDLIGFLSVWTAVTVFTLLVVVDFPLPGMLDVLEHIYSFLGIFAVSEKIFL